MSEFGKAFGAIKQTDAFVQVQKTSSSSSSLLAKPTQKPAPTSGSTSNRISVNTCQRGNPLLQHLLNVPYEMASNIVPDFVLNGTSCALFLSLQYHRLHPDYIYERLKSLGSMYTLRLLLIQVDVDDPEPTLRELTKLSIVSQVTMILGWTASECAKWLEQYKQLEQRPSEALQEKSGSANTSFLETATDVLTTIKGISKTDAMTLVTAFGSIAGIAEANESELLLLPGFGETKAKRVCEAFAQSFVL